MRNKIESLRASLEPLQNEATLETINIMKKMKPMNNKVQNEVQF